MRAFLWVFGLLWLLGVGAFDWMAFSGIYRQARAGSYQSARATVLESRVIEKRGDDSTSYQPYLRYRFEAGGSSYTGERYRYGLPESNRKLARAIVQAHPVGSTMEVYYAPENPSESVVDPQLSGRDGFVVLFLMPFNAIGLGFLLAPWIMRRNGPGGVVVVREGMGWRARLKYTHPLVAAGASLGCFSFVAIFLVGITSSMNPSAATMKLTWMTVAGLSGWAALKAAQSNRLGAGDLRIEPGRIEYSHGSQRESRPVGDIQAVEVKRLEKRDSDGDVTYHYEVELVLHNNEHHGLHTWTSEAGARAFADWLRQRLDM
ncbi:hypothetical protein ABS71_17155 [bacterium SCN 62-11]|nr:DUF3592 domain-containing protein [Candidatus Eremiobacteraeota bacterium]ODT60755.1 MAG: hypothetical protein ABS71_17155 [bacterium SCN 62-11]